MHVRQFHPHLGQAHLARLSLVTERAAELIEAASFLPLLARTPVLRRVRDQIHVSKQAGATLKSPGCLLSSGSEAKLAILAHSVAVFASVRIEYILGKFTLALVGSDHSIKVRCRLFRGKLGFGLREGEQHRGQQSRATEGQLQPPAPRRPANQH